MKKNILLAVAVLFTLIGHAELSKTANVTTPGGILTAIGTDYPNVTNLTVTGTIDARDFKQIGYYMSNLLVLDLSGANIVAYTGTGGPYPLNTVYPINTIPMTALSPISPNYYSRKLTSITLPTTTTCVDNQAFYGCTGLVSVSIPSTVITNFVSGAFYGCTSLASINIPTSVTTLGASIFFNCSKLTTITIPASVTSIGNAVFSGCTSLTSIYAYNPTPVDLSAALYSFGSVNKSTCILHVPVGSKAAYQAAVVWQDFLSIEEGLPASVSNTTTSQSKVYSNPSSIIVEGTSAGEMVTVYNLIGTKLQTIQSQGERLVLPMNQKGVYLVKTANKTVKLIL